MDGILNNLSEKLGFKGINPQLGPISQHLEYLIPFSFYPFQMLFSKIPFCLISCFISIVITFWRLTK